MIETTLSSAILRRRQKNFIDRMKKIHGDLFTYEKTLYRGTKRSIVITCPKHGDIEGIAGNLLRSSFGGCRKCNGTDYSVEDFISKAKLMHGDKYDYSDSRYLGDGKYTVRCTAHGEFVTTRLGHVTKGNGCRMCAIDAHRRTKGKFLEQATKIHGKKYTYVSLPEYVPSELHIDIHCPRHGVFKQRVGSHLQGNGCKACHQESTLLSVEEFIEASRKVHGDKYDYTEVVYTGNKNAIKIICPKHGPFYTRPNSHTSSSAGCPRCNESKGETEIRQFLEQSGIEFEQEFKLPDSSYRYDFCIPDQKILIEFHGQQHYKSVEIFGGDKALKETKARDKEKVRLAKFHGYNLITLNYTQRDKKLLIQVLVKRLKTCYRYWLNVSDEIVVLKDYVRVCEKFKLPGHTNSKTLMSELGKVRPDVFNVF